VRDVVIDFVGKWSEKTEIMQKNFIGWLHMAPSKFYDWQKRYGKANENNHLVPRDHWLEEWEKQAIIEYYTRHALEGYRRITFMMLDDRVVAVSPSSTYRVLKKAGLLDRWNREPSKKGTGFVQPEKPHDHWHIDIAYLNIGGTFFYLCSILDGYSRYIVHWEIRAAMKEADIEMIVQRAKEKQTGVSPRIISDNGSQFIARDFKEFIRLAGMTHVRTSPYYPQSNGKLERYHRTIKSEGWRIAAPETEEEARKVVEKYVNNYNGCRLHSAMGHITPKDKLLGREQEIYQERDRRLEEARQRRKEKREQKRAPENMPAKLVMQG